MNQPRKILVLVSSLGGGGAERVATHLCNAWSAAGNRVSLMATFPDDTSHGYGLSSKVQLITAANTPPGQPKTLWRQLQRLRRLRGLIKSQQADYVVAFLTNVNVAGIIAAMGLGVRVIVCERIYPPRFPIGRALATLRRLTYPRAWRVVVQTTATEQWFAQALPRATTTVIPNPLVLPLEDAPPALAITDVIPTDAKLMLAAGRLDRQKGFADLLQAFAQLRGDTAPWHLVVLGEGPEREALAEQIQALGLEARAHLPGWAGNMADWYSRADVFVLSSHFEGFPNTLLEAMGHGVACVAYDCPAGPADLIEDGHSGRLVAPNAGVAGLAEAMQQLIADAPYRETLAANAATAAERFAEHRVVALWSELLDAA